MKECAALGHGARYHKFLCIASLFHVKKRDLESCGERLKFEQSFTGELHLLA
jgi:hypothetical protein